jgi:hypothetical protein
MAQHSIVECECRQINANHVHPTRITARTRMHHTHFTTTHIVVKFVLWKAVKVRLRCDSNSGSTYFRYSIGRIKDLVLVQVWFGFHFLFFFSSKSLISHGSGVRYSP